MSERIKIISANLAEIAAKRKKESLLKEFTGFQASDKAIKYADSLAPEDIFDEATLERIKNLDLDKSRPRKRSQEMIENAYRTLLGLTNPTIARSEIVITEDEAKKLIETVRLVKNFVLKNGKLPESNGVEVTGPELLVPLNENSALYYASIPSDKDDIYLDFGIYNLTPEIDAVTVYFEKDPSEDLFNFSLIVEFTDDELRGYDTPSRPITEMASNEHRIINNSLNDFLERVGAVPPSN
ncbi:MAG: hypothetical protein M1142_03915 [Patescibacteria group bacterium]|nr:hypothetical protein [Patescibacteria group bacterium]